MNKKEFKKEYGFWRSFVAYPKLETVKHPHADRIHSEAYDLRESKADPAIIYACSKRFNSYTPHYAVNEIKKYGWPKSLLRLNMRINRETCEQIRLENRRNNR